MPPSSAPGRGTRPSGTSSGRSTPAARIAVRVRPGASRTQVGGSYAAGAPGAPAALVVAVTERAVDGAATAAVVRAVAEALGVRPRQVSLVHGATGRDKLLEVADPPADLAQRLGTLLDH